MKQILLIALFCFSSYLSFAQYVYKIKADSVRIYNDSCNAELILENSTKNVTGFLYNKGNGRTEFRKPMIKVNDSLYVFGSDTLRIGNAIGNNSDYIQNQFSAKQNGRFWIDSARIETKLGIGTTASNNSKLDVNGASNFSGNITQSNGRVVLGGLVDDGITRLQSQDLNLTDGLVRRGSDTVLFAQTSNPWVTKLGWQSMRGNPQSSVAFGWRAMYSVYPGNARSSAIGLASLFYMTTGVRNSGLGHASGLNLTTGNDNTFIGAESGQGVTTGSNNTFVGSQSGSAEVTPAANSSNSTFLGALIMGGNYNNTSIDSVIIIGVGSRKTTNAGIIKNTTVIGNGIATDLSNVVLIGQTNQNILLGQHSTDNGSKLQVAGDIYSSGKVIMQYPNVATTFTPANSADPQGNVGDVRYDANYIYIKTATGWKRSALSTW